MKYELIHLDNKGSIKTSHGDISFLAFIKHATLAGLENPYVILNPLRYIHFFCEFTPSFFGSNHFRKYPGLEKDPTETAYLSNRIGRAFADYFSKKIYGAKFTHSYECAMALKKLPIKGDRPDFYCDTLTAQFAVEAKGYSAQSVSNYDMIKHKKQSGTGPLSINFSVASVAYNLYKKPKINFYDPIGGDEPYDHVLNLHLRYLYYQNVMKLIEIISDSKKQSKLPDYYVYNISYPFFPFRQFLVNKEIGKRKFMDTEWLMSMKNINSESQENDDFYIDVDGIGLKGHRKWID
ncbi:hypothetical protein [Morganella morganii]|uniref:hypothetical protein n=1 Tax=Morganella morganii TaxID=582 RepID=UPI001BDA90F2|nr:hypothetical protein [Morganella morganii]MBT0362626.1 hypothetical protein [Morganella morganii subsp. morganii]HDT0625536.1 hypothetical protein [Morganella morganii subsp. morganii]